MSERVYHELADVLAALAHKLSEPLTAIYDYLDREQRALQLDWPEPASMCGAVEQASSHIARSAEGVLLLRRLADRMRNIGSMPPDVSARIGFDFVTGENSVSL